MLESNPPVTYQLKIVLVGISPMIWRRIIVSSDSTIADLHYMRSGIPYAKRLALIALSVSVIDKGTTSFRTSSRLLWAAPEEHLHQFLIHGVHYGIVSTAIKVTVPLTPSVTDYG